jgi:hypothetical protein
VLQDELPVISRPFTDKNKYRSKRKPDIEEGLCLFSLPVQTKRGGPLVQSTSLFLAHS